MTQQDSFRKIYSTKALNIKNPTKNLPPVRPPIFYRCKMTRTEQFIDTRLRNLNSTYFRVELSRPFGLDVLVWGLDPIYNVFS